MTRLDIISDPICPWCYIGAANLTMALENAQAQPFDIHWRPFQLNPDMPPEGVERQAYLDAKFGGPERARQVYARIEAAGAEAGLELHFDRIARTPNTLDAHRLIRWAGAEGVQTPLVGQLFRRYFREGQDISDPEVLVAAATAVGMDEPLVRRLLASDADREETRAEDAAFRAMGVTGVPTFILGNRYAITGAQPPEVWTRVVAELEAATAS
jgi:predicted DsbA family dithiol-disulfide isomerase